MDSFPSLIEALSRSNSAALMGIIVGTFGIVFVKEYLRTVVRLRELRQDKETAGHSSTSNVDGGDASTELRKPSSVVDFNFKLLERYYEQHLVEYRLMARASLVIAIIGFLVIVIGVFFTFADRVSVGLVTSIAGLVSEAAAVLFFKQNNLLIEQIRDYHKKLISTQYLLTTISLAAELPPDHAIRQRERIIGNLLFLSNELHGSVSIHLFDRQHSTSEATSVPSFLGESNKAMHATYEDARA